MFRCFILVLLPVGVARRAEKGHVSSGDYLVKKMLALRYARYLWSSCARRLVCKRAFVFIRFGWLALLAPNQPIYSRSATPYPTGLRMEDRKPTNGSTTIHCWVQYGNNLQFTALVRIALPKRFFLF